MSILYRPSQWERCPRSGRMVKVTRGTKPKARIASQIPRLGK